MELGWLSHTLILFSFLLVFMAIGVPVAFVQWTMPLGAGLMLITQALLIGARWIDGHEVAHRDSW